MAVKEIASDKHAPAIEGYEPRLDQGHYGNRRPEAAITVTPAASSLWPWDRMPQILNCTWPAKKCAEEPLIRLLSLLPGSTEDISPSRTILLWHNLQREVMFHLKAEYIFWPYLCWCQNLFQMPSLLGSPTFSCSSPALAHLLLQKRLTNV